MRPSRLSFFLLSIALILPSLAAAGCGDTFVSSGSGGSGGSTTTTAATGGSGGSTVSAGGAPAGGGGSGGDTSSGGAPAGGGGSGGSTMTGCPDGLALCGDLCVDTATDTHHCGDCGTVCGSLCTAGKCNDPVHVAAGGSTTCAVTQLGDVYCWGRNTSKQLGVGDPQESGVPVKVALPAKATRVALGKNPDATHVCAITDQGDLYCWGPNDNGKLGLGTTGGSYAPTKVLLAPVSALSLGARHTLAIHDGHLALWGANEKGQIAPALLPPTPSLVPLEPVDVFADAIGAGFNHACAVHDETLRCWGANQYGQVGNGMSMMDGVMPTEISLGNPGAAQVKAGEAHTCALDTAGGVHCWGAGAQGQLGQGGTMGKTTPGPVLLPAAAQATAIDCGGNHSGAVVGGKVYLWGKNVEGQTAPGGDDTPVLSPIQVNVPGVALEIALGYAHSCALDTEGRVLCWGHNSDGQTGNGSVDGTDVPVTVVAFPQD